MLRSFDEGRLFGGRTGTGEPTVLALHGWARSHHDFDGVLGAADGPALEAVALDLPGFGASPPPPEAWGGAAYAEAVGGVLSEMAGEFVVVGHSFGGRVAVHLASRYPDRVKGLVLTGVPLLRVTAPRRPKPAFRLVRTLHRRGLVSDDRMEAARRRYGSSTYRNAEGIMRPVLIRAVGETYEEQLDTLACPVALVWGDQDTTAPPAVAQAAAARLHSRDPALEVGLTLLPDVGHLVPVSAPAALRSVIDDMLDGVAGHATADGGTP